MTADDIDPERFVSGGPGCVCGPIYTYGGHAEPGQFAPDCPVHSMTTDAERIAAVLAEHRLTWWGVYPWNGGHEVAPRCTCGVLWSAGNRDDLDAQTRYHEAHVADAFVAAGIGPVREAQAAAWDEFDGDRETQPSNPYRQEASDE